MYFEQHHELQLPNLSVCYPSPDDAILEQGLGFIFFSGLLRLVINCPFASQER
jgi:hypothetical protein